MAKSFVRHVLRATIPTSVAVAFIVFAAGSLGSLAFHLGPELVNSEAVILAVDYSPRTTGKGAVLAAVTGITFTATPNPIQVCDGSGYGITKLSWTSSPARAVHIRVGSATGPTMASQSGTSGAATTGKWVAQGTVFYLVDTNTGLALADTTVGVTANGCTTPPPPPVQPNPPPPPAPTPPPTPVVPPPTATPPPPPASSVTFSASPNPVQVCDGTGYGATKLSWTSTTNRSIEIRVGSSAGTVMAAQSGTSGTATTGKWVGEGTVFFLRDKTTGVTLATVTINLTTSGCAVTPPPPPTTGTNNFNPKGYLDGIDVDGNAYGWSFDPDTASESIDVHFYLDGPVGSGTLIGVTKASTSRPDVNTAFGISGNHGFVFSIPTQYRDGKMHKLYVYGIDSAGNSSKNQLLTTSNGLGYKEFILTSSVLLPPPTPVPPITKIDINGIKSVTYWDNNARLGCSDTLKQDLEAQLPAIKAAGFNAVWLVSWWGCFSTKAFPAPVYDAQSFARVRDVLALLKAHNLKAVLPFNYIENIPGGGENGVYVDFCSVLRYKTATDEYAGYHALRDFIQKYLTEIQDYSKDVVIMLHTEGVLCDAYENPPINTSKLLRNTVGRFPLDIPQELRNKYTIGFHDFVYRWSEPVALTVETAPTPLPSPYDFYSIAWYENQHYQEPYTQMTGWFARLREFYGQDLKIFNGELGADYCYFSASSQASRIVNLVKFAQSSGNGFNVWQWKGHVCGSVGADGFILNDSQGNLLPSGQELKTLLTGSIPEPVSQKLLVSQVNVSATFSASNPNNAIDGSSNTFWNSGGSAPQWLEADLGSAKTVAKIRLQVEQTPAGATTHQVYLGTAVWPNQTLVHTFSGNTSAGQWLEYTLPTPVSARYVSIVTTASPSWVAWREVEVYGN